MDSLVWHEGFYSPNIRQFSYSGLWQQCKCEVNPVTMERETRCTYAIPAGKPKEEIGQTSIGFRQCLYSNSCIYYCDYFQTHIFAIKLHPIPLICIMLLHLFDSLSRTQNHKQILNSLAKCLVHQISVVDLDDAFVLFEQALLSWATLLLHISDVQTQRPDRRVTK